MRVRTIGILLIVLVALLPTWYAAAQTVEHPEEVGIDTEKTDIRPLQSIVDTPQAFTPAQIGVVIWLALGVLVGVLAAFHRFMERLVRPSSGPAARTDGGTYSWFRSDRRWVAEYVGPAESDEGVFVLLGLAATVVALSVLVVVEFLTLARTQYFGLYVGGIFLAFAGMIAGYYAWFLPHVRVAEERYHE
ncbi:MAG: hypothetical protein ABEJ55_05440 [Halanaeroarchaeum sp.]